MLWKSSLLYLLFRSLLMLLGDKCIRPVFVRQVGFESDFLNDLVVDHIVGLSLCLKLIQGENWLLLRLNLVASRLDLIGVRPLHRNLSLIVHKRRLLDEGGVLPLKTLVVQIQDLMAVPIDLCLLLDFGLEFLLVTSESIQVVFVNNVTVVLVIAFGLQILIVLFNLFELGFFFFLLLFHGIFDVHQVSQIGARSFLDHEVFQVQISQTLRNELPLSPLGLDYEVSRQTIKCVLGELILVREAFLEGRVVDDLVDGKPLPGISLKHASQQIPQLQRKFLFDHNFVVDDFVLDVVAGKWRHAHQHFVEKDAHAPYVHFGRIIAVQEHFGTHVLLSATNRGPQLVAFDFARHSEVAQFNIKVLIQEHVFGLDVSVDYSLLMHVLDSLGQLVGETKSEFFGNAHSVVDEVKERPVCGVFHQEIQGVLRFLVANEGYDVAVEELRVDLDFVVQEKLVFPAQLALIYLLNLPS